MKLNTDLNIVESDDTWEVHGSAEGSDLLVPLFDLPDQILRKGRVQNVDNVAERGVDDLVVVGQAVELLRLQVQVDPMAQVDAVGVRVSVSAATL